MIWIEAYAVRSFPLSTNVIFHSASIAVDSDHERIGEYNTGRDFVEKVVSTRAGNRQLGIFKNETDHL